MAEIVYFINLEHDEPRWRVGRTGHALMTQALDTLALSQPRVDGEASELPYQQPRVNMEFFGKVWERYFANCQHIGYE